MEIKVIRKNLGVRSSTGILYVNGVQQCFTLEDRDRGLNKSTPLPEIARIKVPGQTAIPTGRYQVAITWSNKFQKPMPQIMDVPGFQGIRIHPGNTDKDTEGCLLVGSTLANDFIGQSVIAFEKLHDMLRTASKTEKIYIEISSLK